MNRCGLVDCAKVFVTAAVIGVGLGALGHFAFAGRRLSPALPPARESRGELRRLPKGKK